MKSIAFLRAGVALIPEAIISILPLLIAGISPSKLIFKISYFTPARLASSATRSISKPVTLEFSSTNSNGGYSAFVPTMSVSLVMSLAISEPQSKAPATKNLINFFISLSFSGLKFYLKILSISDFADFQIRF